MPNPEPQDSPDFSALEKEALKEISLDIIKSDLKISLTQLHQKNMKEVKEEIAAIEERCAQEIKDGLETQLQKKLKVQFLLKLSFKTVFNLLCTPFFNCSYFLFNFLHVFLMKLSQRYLEIRFYNVQ